MLLNYLKSNYTPGELIFSGEIAAGITETNKRQQLKVLTDTGQLIRIDAGVYCLPKKSRLLNKPLLPTPEAIAESKYIRRGDKRFGYYGGVGFANRLGLTTQIPFASEIVTNETSNPLREVKLCGRSFLLRKPRTQITAENYEILQLLDLLKDADKLCETNREQSGKIVREYIRSRGITRANMDRYLPRYPDKVYKTIYEMRLENVLA